MQAPGPAVLNRLADEIHRAAGHVRRLGMLLRDPRRLVGMDQQPAILQAAVIVGAEIGPVLPWIWRLKTLFAQVLIVARPRAYAFARMQAVVPLVGLKTALRHMLADDGVRRDAERLQAFEVRRHMGLADQHVAHADL